jgi:hypothetical protein
VPARVSSIRTEYLTAATLLDSPRLITTGLSGAPRIMLVKDSFSVAMMPYLEDTFGSIVISRVQDGTFPQQYIEKYRPSIVLLEVQEGGLGVM